VKEARYIPGSLALLLGHLLFFGLFALAFIHMPARVVHVDSAFQIFKWIHVPGVGVEAHRFTAVVPQLLVKAVATTGAPLKVLLTVASLAHVLVPYVIFLIIAYALRLTWIAMALVLAQVLCTRLTFYGIVLEANYLLSYPFLLAAVLSGPLARSQRPAVLLAALGSLFLVLLVHPVGFLVALFVLAFVRLRNVSTNKWIHALMAVALLWPVAARFLFPPTAYEADLYASSNSGLASFGQFFQLPGWRYLVDHTFNYTTSYLAFWCCATALFVLQIRRRAFLQLGLCLAALAGYIALNVITYHQGETAMMMEKNFVPLAVFVALPLMLYLEPATDRQRWSVLVPFVLVLFIQFRGISFASRPANERLALIQQVVDDRHTYGTPKACATHEQLDAMGLHIHWAMAFETLLLSSLDGPEHSVSVVVRDTCPPETRGADLSGLIPEGALCGNGTSWFRLPLGPYAVFSPR